MRLEPFTLTGTHVQLEPLSRAHAPALLAAADRDRSSYGYTNVPADLGSMGHYIDLVLLDAQQNTAVPFAQRRIADGEPVGCTRFMNVAWWHGHDAPVEVEIGGTWLAADAQRSAMNTEAKLLLLTHAFEQWGVHRVAICTDEDNTQSRAAIERLGATLEGVLRNHRAKMGHLTTPGLPRNTACHSIIAEEWPDVRARLQERLGAR
jgi:RimJ/RimL family protein N-acetyltransferase